MNQDEKEKVEDVVFLINAIANEVEHYVQSAKLVAQKRGIFKGDRELEPDEALSQGALMYVVIRVVSFIDEWDHQIGELIKDGIETARFQKLKRVTKPVMKEVRKFTGLVPMRNILAHNARIQSQGYKNAYRGGYLSSLYVPARLPDYLLISDCLKICKEMLNKAFPEFVVLSSDFIKANTVVNLPNSITEAEQVELVAALIQKVRDNVASYVAEQPKETPA